MPSVVELLSVSLLLLETVHSSSEETTSDLVKCVDLNAEHVNHVSLLQNRETYADTEILPMVRLDSIITLDWEVTHPGKKSLNNAVKQLSSQNTLNHWPILESLMFDESELGMILHNQQLGKSIVIITFRNDFVSSLLNAINFGKMARLRHAIGRSVDLYIGVQNGDDLAQKIAKTGTRFMVDQPGVTLRICPQIKGGSVEQQAVLNLNAILESVLTKSDNDRLNVVIVPNGVHYNYYYHHF